MSQVLDALAGQGCAVVAALYWAEGQTLPAVVLSVSAALWLVPIYLRSRSRNRPIRTITRP